MTPELSFEELPDGSKIITIQGINQFGEKYIRQDRIKCPSVWDALKRLTYTVEDMKSAWESGCLVGCEQENDIIYNREKSNYLTFERWIEGRNRNDSRNS